MWWDLGRIIAEIRLSYLLPSASILFICGSILKMRCLATQVEIFERGGFAYTRIEEIQASTLPTGTQYAVALGKSVS